MELLNRVYATIITALGFTCIYSYFLKPKVKQRTIFLIFFIVQLTANLFFPSLFTFSEELAIVFLAVRLILFGVIIVICFQGTIYKKILIFEGVIVTELFSSVVFFTVIQQWFGLDMAAYLNHAPKPGESKIILAALGGIFYLSIPFIMILSHKLVLLIRRKRKHDREDSVHKKKNDFLTVFFYGVQIALCGFLILQYGNFYAVSKYWIFYVGGFIGVLALIASRAKGVNVSSREANLKKLYDKKINEIESEIEFHDRNVGAVNENYQQFKKIKHDIYHLFHEIQLLVYAKEYDAASELVQEIEAKWAELAQLEAMNEEEAI